MKEKKSSEKIETTGQTEPLTQKPTIRDAVTYIVDEQGNEIKVDLITQIKEGDSTDSKKSV